MSRPVDSARVVLASRRSHFAATLFLDQRRKFLRQLLKFRQGVHHHVRMLRMTLNEVLMVWFGCVELLQFGKLGHNRLFSVGTPPSINPTRSLMGLPSVQPGDQTRKTSSPPSGWLPTTSSSPRSGVSAPQLTSEASCALSSWQPFSLSPAADPADEAPATPQSLDPKGIVPRIGAAPGQCATSLRATA